MILLLSPSPLTTDPFGVAHVHKLKALLDNSWQAGLLAREQTKCTAHSDNQLLLSMDARNLEYVLLFKDISIFVLDNINELEGFNALISYVTIHII